MSKIKLSIFHFSKLLEKTSDAVIKAGKTGDLGLVSVCEII